jgi:polar amino acid transport system substrate-binding protein
MLVVLLPLAAESLAQPPKEAFRAVVGVNHAPPYRDLEGDEPSGLYIDIFLALAERMGWEAEFREAPFRRVLKMAEEGEVDILLGPQRTEARSRFLAFVDPLFPPEPKLFFYLSPDHEIHQYQDLTGERVGVLDKASYFPEFDSDDSLVKEPAPRYENLMLMLEKGRVDVVIAPELVGLNALHSSGVNARVAPYRVPGSEAFLVVSRQSPLIEQTDRIHQAVAELKDAGVIEELNAQYRTSTDSPPDR